MGGCVKECCKLSRAYWLAAVHMLSEAGGVMYGMAPAALRAIAGKGGM